MADDFTGKVGLDTTDWKTGTNQMNSDIREIDSGFRVVAAGMDNWTKSAEGLGQRNTALSDIIGKQQQKVSLLEAEHQRMADAAEASGDASASTAKAIQDFGVKVNKAKEELAKSEKELRNNKVKMTELAQEEKEAAKQSGILAEGVKAAEKSLASLGNVAHSAGSAIGAAFVASAKAAGAAIAGLGTAIAAGTKKAFSFTAEAGKMSTTLQNMSQKTGVSTDTLQKFQYASNFINVPAETMANSLSGLEKTMGKAEGGSSKAKKAFKQLGISFRDDATKEMRKGEDVMKDAVDALGKIEDPVKRNAMAMAIFGQSADSLNPLIEAGGQALADYGDEAERMGMVMDGDAVSAMQNFDNSITKLKSTTSAAKTAISKTLMPLFQPLVDLATESMASVATAFQDGLTPESMQTLIDDITTNFTTAFANISTLIEEALPLVTSALSSLINALVEALPGLVETLLPGAMGLLQSVIDAIVENVEPITTLAVTLLTSLAGFLVENLPTLATAAVDLLTGLIDGIIAALPDLIPAAVEMMVALAVALVAAIPSLVEKLPEICTAIFDGLKGVDWLTLGTELLNGLVDGLKNAVTGIIDTVKTIFGGILQAIKDLFGIASPSKETAGIGGFLLDGLIGGISDAIGAAVDMVKKLFGKIWDAIKSIFGFGGESEESKDAKEAGKEITKGVAEGVTSVNGDAETAVKTTGQLILDKFKSVLGVENGNSTITKPYGESAVKGILDGILALAVAETFASVASSLQSAILSALNTAFGINTGLFSDGSIASKFEVVGKAIDAGIAKGIKDNVDLIVSAMKEAAEAAVKAAKEALDIHSPSRVGRKEIGGNFGLSIAMGIQDTTKDITQAMSDAADALANTGRKAANSGRIMAPAQVGSTTVYKTESLTINATEPPSPAETVRLWRNGQRQLEMGIQGGVA